MDQQIAAAPPPHVGHPAAPQQQHRARLGAPSDGDALGAVERLVVEPHTQRGLRERHVQLVHQVAALAVEARMGTDPGVDVQVAVGPAPGPGRPPAAEAQRGAVVHPRRHLNAVGAALELASMALALTARLFDHLAQAAAAVARRSRHHLAQHRLAHLAHLAGAAALRAAHRRSPRRSAAAVAGLAVHGGAHAHFTLGAEHHVAQVEVHMGLEVLAGGRSLAARRGAEAPEGRVGAEEGVEDAAQPSTEGIGHASRVGVVGAEAVVPGAPLGIRQHLVGRAQLLEPGLGAGIAGVGVRVVLARQLAVRPFELLVGGVAGNAESLVVVGHLRLTQSWRRLAATGHLRFR